MAESRKTAGDVPEQRDATGPAPQQPDVRVPMTEEQIRAATISEPAQLTGPIEIVDYDPAWPRLFAREAERVRAALGDRVLLLEHVGSTSVPGLAAKPRIDILLAVADSADEPAYVPPLEAAGYVLCIREPDWYEHRVFKGPDTDVNLHVFSLRCPEIDRMLLFRDWLRAHPADRQLYEQTKRDLARQDWKYTQNYADAKTAVVEEIIARAQRSAEGAGDRRGSHGEDPPMEVATLDQLIASARASGERFHEFLRRDALSAGMYILPGGGIDDQRPHREDEVYVVVRGSGRITIDGRVHEVGPGSVIFVAAGVEHRFFDFPDDLEILVLFGPAYSGPGDDAA